MESGACAVGAGLLQPQTGRPVTKHCTAQGLTTTTATGIDIRKSCQRDNNTDTPEYSEYFNADPLRPRAVLGFGACFAWGARAVFLFPGTEDISRALTVLRYSGRPVEGAAGRPALRVF